MLNTLPPPHDPNDRQFLTRSDGWEVRVFSERDIRYPYFARKHMLHLQLLHPQLRVSVLTPSKLTADRWEICSPATPKLRFAERADLDVALRKAFGIRAPNPVTLAGLDFWFVRIPGGSIDTIEIRAFG